MERRAVVGAKLLRLLSAKGLTVLGNLTARGDFAGVQYGACTHGCGGLSGGYGGFIASAAALTAGFMNEAGTVKLP